MGPQMPRIAYINKNIFVTGKKEAYTYSGLGESLFFLFFDFKNFTLYSLLYVARFVIIKQRTDTY